MKQRLYPIVKHGARFSLFFGLLSAAFILLPMIMPGPRMTPLDTISFMSSCGYRMFILLGIAVASFTFSFGTVERERLVRLNSGPKPEPSLLSGGASLD